LGAGLAVARGVRRAPKRESTKEPGWAGKSVAGMVSVLGGRLAGGLGTATAREKGEG